MPQPDVDRMVEFIRAQLDADEQMAVAAARTSAGGEPRYTRWDLSEWHGTEEPHALVGQGTQAQPLALGHFIHQSIPRRHAEHIACHDPARALAEVEAKRFLLEWAIAGMDRGGLSPLMGYNILAGLALAYRSYPDYDQSWRPT